MRYLALACDYDGTIATHGIVDDATLAALERLRTSGRKLILVTGRELRDLLAVFPHTNLFAKLVVENGAVIYDPATGEETVLAEAPPPEFAKELEARGVQPLSVGRVIVATWEPHETMVLDAIRSLGLELQVIFNKGAVMVLPTGVNKAAGLRRALEELALSAHNTVGVGDAENDHAFLSLCECSAAVANALPQLKERADIVTAGDHGAGVTELIELLIQSDMQEFDSRLTRRKIEIGVSTDGAPVMLSSYGRSILVTGASGAGKSTLAASLIERLTEQKYQFCMIDPEGDYENLEFATMIGNAQNAPVVDEVIQVLNNPEQNVVVNLLSVDMKDRPGFFQALMARLGELRAKTGRPHWIIADETHHLAPLANEADTPPLPQDQNIVLITVHPEGVASSVLTGVNTVITVGDPPEGALQALSTAVRDNFAAAASRGDGRGGAMIWRQGGGGEIMHFRVHAPAAERRRHKRKYAEGELGEDRSFYFRGPESKLNLRAHNLNLFIHLGQGVDDETWQYHLERGDYSAWFKEAIKDEELATEVIAIEKAEGLTARESRESIEKAIRQRYIAST